MRPWRACSSTACFIKWISLGATPTWPFIDMVAQNRARWTYRVACIRVSLHICSTVGDNHRGLCRFAFPVRSIAAQTVSCFLSNMRMLWVADLTNTAQRLIGIRFLASILWLLPFWNGAIR